MDKKCIKCNKVKPLAVFAEFEQRGRKYRHSQCNQCRNSRAVKVVRHDRNGVLLRGTPEQIAARIATIAGHRDVLCVKVGEKSVRVIGTDRMLGIYTNGCDYRDILSELAA